MSDQDDDRLLIQSLRTVVVVGVVLALFGTAWLFMQGHGDLWWSRFAVHNAVGILIFFYVLWRMIPRQPRNPVVWTLTAVALGGIYVTGLAVVAAMLEGDLVTRLGTDLNPSELPTAAAWVMVFTFSTPILAYFPLLTLGLLYFPDGRLPSPRWRGVAWLAVVGILMAAIGDAWVHRPDSLDNNGSVQALGLMLSGVTILLCLAGLVVRFRHSSGTTQQQFKWIVWGASIFGPAIVFSVIASGTALEDFSRPLTLAAGGIMFGSYAVAVARYRLYDVDLVINRTVVFVGLAGFITLVYAVLVVGLGRLVGGGDGLLLPILATAVVAVAFEPVRRRTQAWANHLVYGRRATPYEVLSDMTRRLAAAGPGEQILEQMARLLQEGTGAGRVTVWLGPAGEMEPVVSSPSDPPMYYVIDLEDVGVFPVSHDGEIVGALELVPSPGVALSPSDKSLVSDLAGSAGLVLGYQRLNGLLAERAAEVDESRARLVGAEDEERRRLEDELRGVVHEAIGELQDRVATASELAREHDAADLASLLGGVAGEAATALSEVRSLAQGLYPPVLATEGLTAAVCGLAESVPVEVRVSGNGVTRYPAGVEAAIYFNVSEAITNAVKHANPPIRVELKENGDMFRFTVSDRGPGFDVDAVEMGSGLENMRDRLDAVGGRLHIESTSAGTEVCGEVMLASVART